MACLWGYLFSFAHMAVVQHVSCPEHGELVHAGPGGSATGEAAGNAGSYISGQSEEHPADDHCLLAGLTTAKAKTPLAAGVGPQVPGDAHGASGGELLPPGVPVLLWAPKPSPPFAARRGLS